MPSREEFVQPANAMTDSVVSVVIPVQATSCFLGRCLESVLRQNYGNKEVIIVCGPRAEASDALPKGSEDIRVIRERREAPSAYLANSGLRAARGHIKVLLKPSCVPVGENWLREMAAPFDDDEVGVVVSRRSLYRGKKAGVVDRLLECVSPHSAGTGRQELLSQECDAYRASLLADIGYFSEDVPGPGEVVEASLRVADAGYRIVTAENARVSCRPRGRGRAMEALKCAADYGRSDAVLEKKHDVRWLNCGVFGAAIFGLLLVPLAALSLPLAFVASVAIFAWGWFLSLRVPLVGWELPVFVLNFSLYVAVALLIRDGWRPALLGVEVHPAMLRQGCWLVAVLGSYLLLLGWAALGCALRTCRQPHGWLYAVPVAILSLGWWLGTGVGYLLAVFPGTSAER